MKEFGNIEDSLVKTLKESDLSRLSNDIRGIIFTEIVKSIPVFGTIHNLFKIGLTIRDYIFVNKLVNFLSSLKDITCDERQKLIHKLESDDDFKQKVGEYIILLLDRIDDMQKPILVAKAFRAYLEGKIDGIQLQRINFGIDRVLGCNLSELKKYYSIETPTNRVHDILKPMVFQNLASCGFLDLNSGLGGGVGTTKNELGRIFVKYIL